MVESVCLCVFTLLCVCVFNILCVCVSTCVRECTRVCTSECDPYNKSDNHQAEQAQVIGVKCWKHYRSTVLEEDQYLYLPRTYTHTHTQHA